MNAPGPKQATRRAAILAALLAGEKITIIDALARGWGWSIAGDAHALRRLGWAIETEMVDRGKGRSRIARYWLPRSARNAE